MCYDMAQTDKLGIFVDDARRLGIAICGPDINASGAEFDVEVTGRDESGNDMLAVRYALAALKSVGEGAMDKLVLERDDNGAFRSLDDLATRVDPRLINKRQLETLAAGGAFDSIDLNRAGIHATAETILAIAARTHEGRTSGQGGLFGSESSAADTIKLPKSVSWTLAQRMEQEKEAFGFYFSSHPVDRHAHLARMHGARQFTALGELTIPDDGTRAGAMMAVLVEDARWRTSARGRRYLMATLSDASGQFVATCFDDAVAKDLEDAARAGGCGLATVELDRRPGEDTPRVSVKRIQPFEGLASMARFVVEIAVMDDAAFAALGGMLRDCRGGRGEVRVRAPLPGGEATVLLGRDFLLDGELVGHLERLPGVESVALRTSETRLQLVG
jgi:DNA polymerase-3 subunit alpha